MRTTVGLAQFLATPADPRGNLDLALGHIASLAASGCDLILLPELWPCGFSWDTLADDARAAAEPLDGPRGAVLGAAAAAAGAWVLAGTVPEATAAGVANAAVLYAPDGRLAAVHRKVRLYTPLHEERAFAAGDALTVVEHPQLGPAGIATCFDGDFPEVARALRRAGARVVLHPAAYEVAARGVVGHALSGARARERAVVVQRQPVRNDALRHAARREPRHRSARDGGGRGAARRGGRDARRRWRSWSPSTCRPGSRAWDASCDALVAEAREVPPVRVIRVA